MKYALFALALAGSIPLAAVCSLSKKYIARLMGLVFVVVLCFDGTAVNFISYEFYRGTSRGLEVSLAGSDLAGLINASWAPIGKPA